MLTLGLGQAATARAELLYFKAGGAVQARAEVKNGRVRIDVPFGVSTFPESDFARIVPGHDPEREWPARRERALKGGASERLDAAWWALGSGLTDESTAMIRDARTAFPGDPQAARLGAILDRLDRPCPDGDVTTLLEAVGVTCLSVKSRHVGLFHQGDAQEAERRVRLLEQIVVAYHLWFGFQGIDLPPPVRKLVCVHFGDQPTYLRFLEAHHAGAFRETQGYYHPTFHVVFTYDARQSDRWAKLRSGFETQDARTTEAVKADRRRREFLWQEQYWAHDLGTAAHEMVHLLVEASGLATDPGQFPVWFHEGLAAQFEVVRGGRWAGVGRANDLRLIDWRLSEGPHRLMPLVRDVGFGRGYSGCVYAESWALVYSLQRLHPDRFAALIDRLKTPDRLTRQAPADRFSSLFLEVVGSDPTATQREWLSHLSAMRTPLEENAPTAVEAATISPATAIDRTPGIVKIR